MWRRCLIGWIGFVIFLSRSRLVAQKSSPWRGVRNSLRRCLLMWNASCFQKKCCSLSLTTLPGQEHWMLWISAIWAVWAEVEDAASVGRLWKACSLNLWQLQGVQSGLYSLSVLNVTVMPAGVLKVVLHNGVPRLISIGAWIAWPSN